MLTIIDFAIKVYVCGKLLDKIEDVGKKLGKKFSNKNKKGNEEIIETYFVD